MDVTRDGEFDGEGSDGGAGAIDEEWSVGRGGRGPWEGEGMVVVEGDDGGEGGEGNGCCFWGIISIISGMLDRIELPSNETSFGK